MTVFRPDFANSTTAKVTLAGAIALGGVANVNAQSLPLVGGKCHDSATTQAMLKADGQLPLIIGNRNTDDFPLNVIMMNDKGYGYNFEEKKAEKQICLRVAFKDAQLNYEDNTLIPAWGLAIKKTNGFDVEKIYANQGRLVFAAQSYSRDASGKEIVGKAIVIGILPSKKLGTVFEVDGSGIADTSFDLNGYKIVTQNYTHFIGRGFGSIASAQQNNNILLAQEPKPKPK